MKILTMPEDLHKFKKDPSYKQKLQFVSEPDISSENLKISEDCLKISTEDKETKNASNRLSEIFLTLKKLRWRFFFKEVFLRNVYAFCFLVILVELQIYIHQYIFCGLDNSNVLTILYCLTSFSGWTRQIIKTLILYV